MSKEGNDEPTETTYLLGLEEHAEAPAEAPAVVTPTNEGQPAPSTSSDGVAIEERRDVQPPPPYVGGEGDFVPPSPTNLANDVDDFDEEMGNDVLLPTNTVVRVDDDRTVDRPTPPQTSSKTTNEESPTEPRLEAPSADATFGETDIVPPSQSQSNAANDSEEVLGDEETGGEGGSNTGERPTPPQPSKNVKPLFGDLGERPRNPRERDLWPRHFAPGLVWVAIASSTACSIFQTCNNWLTGWSAGAVALRSISTQEDIKDDVHQLSHEVYDIKVGMNEMNAKMNTINTSVDEIKALLIKKFKQEEE